MTRSVFDKERQQILNIDDISIETAGLEEASTSVAARLSEKHQVCKVMQAGAFGTLV